MPYTSEKIRIDNTMLDKRRKLTPKQKEEIKEIYKKGTCGTRPHNPDRAKTDFAIEQILDIKEKSFGTRETKLVFDIPPVQDVFDNIESKLKELMGDKYE